MDPRSAAAVVLTTVRLERSLSQQTAAEQNKLQGSVWSKLETGAIKPYSRELTVKLEVWTTGAVRFDMWEQAPSQAQLDRLKVARVRKPKPSSKRAA